MRKVFATMAPGTPRRAYRVVNLEQLAATWVQGINFAVVVNDTDRIEIVEGLTETGLPNVCWVRSEELEYGDIIFSVPGKDFVDVSYRQSDIHHTLFLTNRCNSNCLMCSQPPTSDDDGWLVDEAIDIVRHIDISPKSIGITGGEPLLLGAKLRRVLDEITLQHPHSRIDLLTNGRLLSDPNVVASVLGDLKSNVTWLIPLYGHAHMLHDFVVQAPGAFEQTLEGLLRLQKIGYAIQLRVVLIEPVMEWLVDLCEFIGKNLPFVYEVAFMACEPIGFALANRDICNIDLRDWQAQLVMASNVLRRNDVPHIFMNAPHCALPGELWPFAQRSISDWKQVYLTECDDCAAKTSCSGLFAWHERGWAPTKILKIEGELI